MQIGDLAKSAGVTVQTVRFYERKGLLPSPPRIKDSGYRVYSETDLRRLQIVRQTKRLGFSLDETKSILRMRGLGMCPCNEVIGIADGILWTPNNKFGICSGFVTNCRERSRCGSDQNSALCQATRSAP